MLHEIRPIVLASALSIVPAFAGICQGGFIAFSEGGDNSAVSIQGVVDDFRAALGDPNNGNNPGPIVGGRREINWDGGGSTVASPGSTPFEVFTDSRGAFITTPGSGFLQTPLDDPPFTGINPTYETTFGFFSPVRIFTPLDSNVTEVTFSVPGTDGGVPATVSGFGAVFSDVDLADTTTLEFFSFGGDLLFSQSVEVGTTSDASLSFLGVVADAGERIARVRIITGTTALGPDDDPSGGVDVVVMDDFLYAEPTAIPEPAGITLLGIGAVGMALVLRRRRAAPEATP